MKTCVIFGAGEYDAYRPAYDENFFYIAADGGLKEMLACGITPNLLIGDFDSLDITPPQGIPHVRLPVQKDVTDMDAAVAEGRIRGYSDFILLGGMGGRPDHTMANYSLLARLSQQNCTAKLYGEGFTVTAVTDGAVDFAAGYSGTAAVFSWTDVSEGVDIKGMAYELENGRLVNNFALGVSNRFTGAPARIEVKKGTLLIMAETP